GDDLPRTSHVRCAAHQRLRARAQDRRWHLVAIPVWRCVRDGDLIGAHRRTLARPRADAEGRSAPCPFSIVHFWLLKSDTSVADTAESAQRTRGAGGETPGGGGIASLALRQDGAGVAATAQDGAGSCIGRLAVDDGLDAVDQHAHDALRAGG